LKIFFKIINNMNNTDTNICNVTANLSTFLSSFSTILLGVIGIYFSYKNRENYHEQQTELLLNKVEKLNDDKTNLQIKLKEILIENINFKYEVEKIKLENSQLQQSSNSILLSKNTVLSENRVELGII
tara:strand:- start:7696 stop:8079 length:384 start_codon:yes stop_codon:yes gene_type:complete